MGVGLSGMISGLDTDSIVKAMVASQTNKKVNIDNKITMNKWTNEAWSGLNKKIYSFYTEYASKLRLKSSYQTKSVSISNENAASVSAASKAANGTHSLKVISTASSQYVTGKKLATTKSFDSDSRLAAVSNSLEGQTIKLTTALGTANEESFELTIDANTKIKDLTEFCKEHGVQASYDDTQKRFFFSAAESGADNAFSITSNVPNQTYIDDTNAFKASGLSEDEIAALPEDDQKIYQTAMDTLLAAKGEDVAKALDNTIAYADLTKEQRAIFDSIAKIEAYMTSKGRDEDDRVEFQDKLTTYASYSDAAKLSGGDLSGLGLGTNGIDGSSEVKESDGLGYVVVKASNAKVILDGATMESASNTITVNGLTINAKNTTYNKNTGDYDTVSVTVNKNTDSTYQLVKDAIKAYNELIDEMSKNYYADSARSYKPLTDEQKEEMTDTQIEDWENKIKSAVLRRDSTLGSLMQAMRTSLQTTWTNENEIDSATGKAKAYSLASFGISTGTYTEYGKLHIYGDSDDNTFATYDNRLKDALDEDPDKVMEALSSIFSNLYTTMSDKCAKTKVSSALTFYNDKQYSTELTNYEKDLKTMEEKITDLEDRYYKQFTAMEKAMAQLQSKSSALSQMLGTSS